MRKYGVLETTFAISASYAKQIKEAANFIVHQPTTSLADDTLKNMVMTKCSSSLETPISMLFQHLTESFRAARELPFVHIFITAQNPPEIFTSDAITFNFNEAMANPPSVINGTVLNLTDSVTLKKSLASTEYTISDVIKIQSLCVRSALCQSYLYCTDKPWLTPNLCLLIIESYNMIITNQVRQNLNITDPYILKKVAFINCAFMAQMLGTEVYKGLPEILFRLNNGLTTKETQALYSELVDKGFDFKRKYRISDVCAMYQAVCGERFAKFDISIFSRLFTSGSVNKPFANLMMEYPPFWVYQLLLIGSGIKQTVYNNIFNNNRFLPKIQFFARDLNTTESFIASL